VPKDTPSPHLRRLGRRIKELRQAKGLTQEKLARRSRVSRVYLSGIERGIRNLTLLHFISIAKSLRVDPRTLLD
jgi:transcriptional regulator with XRE-family HTH domain